MRPWLALVAVLCACGPASPPPCVSAKIAEMASAPRANPPASVTRYRFLGEDVFFVPQRCCDIPSDLYSSRCELICHPDGGLSGAGDGRCPAFFALAREAEEVWRDPR
jgi:hypothetical protein